MSKENITIYLEKAYTQKERKGIVANQLKMYRIMRGLQKKEVAELIGIKPQTYGAYENGRNEAPLEVVVRLAILYDKTVDQILKTGLRKGKETNKELNREFSELQKRALSGDVEAEKKLYQILSMLNEDI